jgi:hypothetical protein
MVESTVILSARICAAELATLVAGPWAFADFSPIAAIQSAATQIEIKQRKGFLTRTRRYVGAKQYSKVARQSISRQVCGVYGLRAHEKLT